MTELVVVYITVSTRAEAESIGTALVENRLAACANIWEEMTSIYVWKGATHREKEVVLMAKTRADCFSALEQKVREYHSYECPCIVAFPVAAGHAPFLQWIKDQTTSPRRE